MILIVKLLSLLILSIDILNAINLEESPQDFILETKRIIIPEFPLAFNPSIIRYQDRLLMTFRFIPDPKQSFTSHIGVVWLDDNFQPATTPQILTLLPTNTSALIPSRAEDARLISVKDTLYIVYSDNRDEKITKGGFRVYIAKLQVNGNDIYNTNIDILTDYPGESNTIREKNWVPFIFQDNLLLAYSLDPHVIFQHTPGTNHCDLFATSKSPINWNWGILRGGTPAMELDEGYYFGFFHSSIKMATQHSQGKDILHYFMGAYTFDLKPPFKIRMMSPEPIIDEGFYSGEIYKPYWHPVRAIFPGGFIIIDEFIYVVFGRQDHEIWITKLNKNDLLNSLVPVAE